MQLRINIPPLTRILLALDLAVFIAHRILRHELHDTHSVRQIEPIALEPQQSLFYPWVYLTATYAEQNLLTLAVAGLTIFYAGRYLERAWSSVEFGKFVLITTFVPNLLASIIYIAWFAVTRDVNRTFTTIQGSVAIQGAFLVAFKQLVPEHTFTILRGLVKVRVKHFPAIFLLANTLSGFILGTDTALVLAWAGFLTAWFYLRFYKLQPDLSTASTNDDSGASPPGRGDASETFTFAAFWPDVIQPPITALSDRIYPIAVTLRIVRPFTAEDFETSNAQATSRAEGGLGGLLNQSARRSGRRDDADRRRALALKALDQRLLAATAGTSAPPATQATPPAASDSAPQGSPAQPESSRLVKEEV